MDNRLIFRYQRMEWLGRLWERSADEWIVGGKRLTTVMPSRKAGSDWHLGTRKTNTTLKFSARTPNRHR